MSKNTSIALGPHFDSFIHDQIESGRFKNVSEVIRAGLRLLEERDEKKKAVLKALEEGLLSPAVADFDPQDFYQKTQNKVNYGSLPDQSKGTT
ncbi:type II toxin-antitoxin system ParD family antitoxin [Cryomorphaceae bacterium]|nr:type II toxin-antitoxin system ParD family antitoxin [Cryomorphaceae bacterium]